MIGYLKYYLITPKPALLKTISYPLTLLSPTVWAMNQSGIFDPDDFVLIAKYFFLVYLKFSYLRPEQSRQFFGDERISGEMFDHYWEIEPSHIGTLLAPGTVANMIGVATLRAYRSGNEKVDIFLERHAWDIEDDAAIEREEQHIGKNK